MSHTAFIGVGTNLGDRLRNYKTALEKISAIKDTRIVAKSSMYESEPHGKARNWFLNGVVEVTTELEAAPLLKELQKIEAALGRKRETSKASVSREMDLDILLFGQRQLDEPRLQVPHYHMHARAFVLYPLAEIAEDLQLPDGRPLQVLLAACPFEGLERLPDLAVTP